MTLIPTTHNGAGHDDTGHDTGGDQHPEPLEQPEGSGSPAHAVQAMVYGLAGEVAAFSPRLTALEDRVEDIAGALDLIESVLNTSPAPRPDLGADEPTAPTAPAGGPDPGQQPEVGLDMRRLVAWVRDNIALLLERKIPQTGGFPYWCRKWWLHPEAIARFEAARRSWAEAVTAGDGNAMVVWFEHLDHQLGVLCAEYGPFCGCVGGHKTSRSTALGQDEPDEAYFTDFDLAREAAAP